jgi:hypothetical protein
VSEGEVQLESFGREIARTMCVLGLMASMTVEMQRMVIESNVDNAPRQVRQSRVRGFPSTPV